MKNFPRIDQSFLKSIGIPSHFVNLALVFCYLVPVAWNTCFCRHIFVYMLQNCLWSLIPRGNWEEKVYTSSFLLYALFQSHILNILSSIFWILISHFSHYLSLGKFNLHLLGVNNFSIAMVTSWIMCQNYMQKSLRQNCLQKNIKTFSITQ